MHYFKEKKVYNIALSGLLSALSLIALFFSSIIPAFPPFNILGLKVDLSLIFIIIIFFKTNIYYGLASFLIRFLIGPFLSVSSFDPTLYFGHFILLITGTIYVFWLLFFVKMIKVNLLASLIIATFLTALIMTLLNIFFITPLYFNILKFTDGPFINSTLQTWDASLKKYFLNWNYFLAFFVAYFPFNLVNFSITSAFVFVLIKYLKIDKKMIYS
ncbi:MPN527 family putative ECF transporter permease subunit [Mycoplasma procyoni]|uniref:MPN527 family putative ECF transporter permease subunit n=1 Tax=Mycoplasma procyoni TaxID=568784 RepID=UPI00197CB0B3|nr:ECF transporter S component [Mycoplasma procyoni]MBN3535118.1 hypothetical protein [Mycoplasma procyoni]